MKQSEIETLLTMADAWEDNRPGLPIEAAHVWTDAARQLRNVLPVPSDIRV